jgi:hypothetical protein
MEDENIINLENIKLYNASNLDLKKIMSQIPYTLICFEKNKKNY